MVKGNEHEFVSVDITTGGNGQQRLSNWSKPRTQSQMRPRQVQQARATPAAYRPNTSWKSALPSWYSAGQYSTQQEQQDIYEKLRSIRDKFGEGSTTYNIMAGQVFSSQYDQVQNRLYNKNNDYYLQLKSQIEKNEAAVKAGDYDYLKANPIEYDPSKLSRVSGNTADIDKAMEEYANKGVDMTNLGYVYSGETGFRQKVNSAADTTQSMIENMLKSYQQTVGQAQFSNQYWENGKPTGAKAPTIPKAKEGQSPFAGTRIYADAPMGEDKGGVSTTPVGNLTPSFMQDPKTGAIRIAYGETDVTSDAHKDTYTVGEGWRPWSGDTDVNALSKDVEAAQARLSGVVDGKVFSYLDEKGGTTRAKDQEIVDQAMGIQTRYNMATSGTEENERAMALLQWLNGDTDKSNRTAAAGTIDSLYGSKIDTGTSIGSTAAYSVPVLGAALNLITDEDDNKEKVSNLVESQWSEPLFGSFKDNKITLQELIDADGDVSKLDKFKEMQKDNQSNVGKALSSIGGAVDWTTKPAQWAGGKLLDAYRSSNDAVEASFAEARHDSAETEEGFTKNVQNLGSIFEAGWDGLTDQGEWEDASPDWNKDVTREGEIAEVRNMIQYAGDDNRDMFNVSAQNAFTNEDDLDNAWQLAKSGDVEGLLSGSVGDPVGATELGNQLVFDPLNLVGPGVVTAPVKAIRAASTSARLAKPLGNLADESADLAKLNIPRAPEDVKSVDEVIESEGLFGKFDDQVYTPDEIFNLRTGGRYKKGKLGYSENFKVGKTGIDRTKYDLDVISGTSKLENQIGKARMPETGTRAERSRVLREQREAAQARLKTTLNDTEVESVMDDMMQMFKEEPASAYTQEQLEGLKTYLTQTAMTKGMSNLRQFGNSVNAENASIMDEWLNRRGTPVGNVPEGLSDEATEVAASALEGGIPKPSGAKFYDPSKKDWTRASGKSVHELRQKLKSNADQFPEGSAAHKELQEFEDLVSRTTSNRKSVYDVLDEGVGGRNLGSSLKLDPRFSDEGTFLGKATDEGYEEGLLDIAESTIAKNPELRKRVGQIQSRIGRDPEGNFKGSGLKAEVARKKSALDRARRSKKGVSGAQRQYDDAVKRLKQEQYVLNEEYANTYMDVIEGYAQSQKFTLGDVNKAQKIKDAISVLETNKSHPDVKGFVQGDENITKDFDISEFIDESGAVDVARIAEVADVDKAIESLKGELKNYGRLGRDARSVFETDFMPDVFKKVDGDGNEVPDKEAIKAALVPPTGESKNWNLSEYARNNLSSGEKRFLNRVARQANTEGRTKAGELVQKEQRRRRQEWEEANPRPKEESFALETPVGGTERLYDMFTARGKAMVPYFKNSGGEEIIKGTEDSKNYLRNAATKAEVENEKRTRDLLDRLQEHTKSLDDTEDAASEALSKLINDEDWFYLRGQLRKAGVSLPSNSNTAIRRVAQMLRAPGAESPLHVASRLENQVFNRMYKDAHGITLDEATRYMQSSTGKVVYSPFSNSGWGKMFPAGVSAKYMKEAAFGSAEDFYKMFLPSGSPFKLRVPDASGNVMSPAQYRNEIKKAFGRKIDKDGNPTMSWAEMQEHPEAKMWLENYATEIQNSLLSMPIKKQNQILDSVYANTKTAAKKSDEAGEMLFRKTEHEKAVKAWEARRNEIKVDDSWKNSAYDEAITSALGRLLNDAEFGTQSNKFRHVRRDIKLVSPVAPENDVQSLLKAVNTRFGADRAAKYEALLEAKRSPNNKNALEKAKREFQDAVDAQATFKRESLKMEKRARASRDLHMKYIREDAAIQMVLSAGSNDYGNFVKTMLASDIPGMKFFEKTMRNTAGIAMGKAMSNYLASTFMAPSKALGEDLGLMYARATNATPNIMELKTRQMRRTLGTIPLAERKQYGEWIRDGVNLIDAGVDSKVAGAFEESWKLVEPYMTSPAEIGKGIEITFSDINRYLTNGIRLDLKGLHGNINDLQTLLRRLHKTTGRGNNERVKLITDPYEAIWNVQIAVENAIASKTLRRSVGEMLGVKPPAGSQEQIKAAQQGYSRLKKMGWKEHPFINQVYGGVGPVFHPDMYEYITRLENIMKPAEVGDMMRKFDQVVHTWKQATTIYNPGFWSRNAIGEMTATWLMGDFNVVSHKQAIDTVRYMRNEGGEVRALQEKIPALRAMGEKQRDLGKTVVFKLNDGTKVTRAMIASEYMRSGMKSGFFNTEFQNMNSATGPVGNLPGGNLLQEGHAYMQLNAEGFEDAFRMGHFIEVLKKNKNLSLEQAVKKASQRVKKAHFDYNDFSKFDKAVMLRVFPFFKWTRKAMPFMLEMLALKPGKTTLYPRAVHDYTETFTTDDINGGDSGFAPVYSDMVPVWVQDNWAWRLGSEGEIPGKGTYFSAKDPITSVASMYQRPEQTAYNLLNPLAKIPLQAGVNAETKGEVGEESLDAIVKSLPQGSFGDKIVSGKAESTDFASFVTGLGIYNVTPEDQKWAQLYGTAE